MQLVNVEQFISDRKAMIRLDRHDSRKFLDLINDYSRDVFLEEAIYKEIRRLIRKKRIPSDSIFYGLFFDYKRGVYYMILISKKFDPVMEGAEVPWYVPSEKS